MALDWDRPVAPETVAGAVELIGTGGGASGPRSLKESTQKLGDRERLGRLEDALRRRGVDTGLEKQLLAGAGEGLHKVRGEARPELTMRDAIGLEAVVLADGTRPSLRVRSGFIDVEALDASAWKGDLMQHEDAIRRVIQATGKVVAPVLGGFVGSAIVVADDVVVTNRHVAEAIAIERDDGWELRWPGQIAIDFQAEEPDGPPAEWDVGEVIYAGPDRIGDHPSLAKLDVALLRCSRRPGAQARAPILPDPGGKPAGSAALALDRAVYALGIPARPQKWEGEGKPPPSYEIGAVISGIFEDVFGVKRLAPGRIKRLPETLPTGKGRVFSHDCSTLGGNSGSAVVDLAVDGETVMGIHFGGASRIANYAHGFAAIRPDLPADVALRSGDD